MAKFVTFLLVGAATAIAVSFFIFSPRWSEELGKKFDTEPAAQPEVGQILLEDGKGSLRSYGHTEFSEFSGSQTLHHLDTLQVQTRGRAKLTLPTQQEVRILGPALVVFEKWFKNNQTSPLVLHLILGQLESVKEGTPGQLYILKNGNLTDIKGASGEKAMGMVISPLWLGEPPPADPGAEVGGANAGAISIATRRDQEPNEALSNEYLDQRIAQERELLQRCQSNALKEQSNIKGQLLVGLTISPDGKVTETQVLATDMQNEKLKSCVLDVMGNIRFKAFVGTPIVRSYPIQFE